MSLEIREESVEATCVLGLSGRLDTETSGDLELAVQDLLQAGRSHFVLDLGGVGYVSSAGLRVLLMLAKTVDGKGSLGLAGLNASVRQVFDVAGFTPLFSIFADRAAALGAAAPVRQIVADSVGEPAARSARAKAVADLLGAGRDVASTSKAPAGLADRAARALGIGATS